LDWPIAPGGIVEGAGKYAGSASAIMVEHPETGARSELGSLAVSDVERQWIWDHRTALEGHAVAKFEAMEITDAGAVPRWRVHQLASRQGRRSRASGYRPARIIRSLALARSIPTRPSQWPELSSFSISSAPTSAFKDNLKV
jgi:hypothetical protein